METLFHYFLKVNGLLIVFYVSYHIFLRKETFFQSNRWFLLLGIISSILLPLITFTKIIWVNPEPIVNDTKSYFPVTNKIIEVSNAPFDWNLFFIYCYFSVSLFFLFKLGFEIYSFFKIVKKGNQIKQKNIVLVETNELQNPFSFFNYLVFNKSKFTDEELAMILMHEKIHIEQKHSIDVLISKLLCLFLWINPISWLYRKAIVENLEFIADNKTSSLTNKAYQYQKTLLKVVAYNNQLSITNQFYQSLIKKRIVMLNKNQSQKKNVWKYGVVFPLLGTFMFLFQIETIAQEKESKPEKISYVVSTSYSSILSKNTTDKELKELEKTFSGENHKLIISNVKRNKNNEIIGIKLVFDSGRTYVRVFERKSTKPINDIKIYVDRDNKDEKTFGFEDVEELTAVEVLVDYDDMDTIQINGFDSDKKYWSLDNMKKNGQDVILIINGKIKGATEKVKFPMNEELGEMNELTPKAFEKKYNQKADKNKVYFEVETIKLKTVVGSYNDAAKVSESKKITEVEKKEDGWGVSFETSSSDDNISRIKEDKNVDAKKALLIFNGNEINYEDLNKINPSEILATSITKNANAAELKKYGEKVKYGIISIETKEYFQKNSPIYKSLLHKKSSELNKKKEVELKGQQNSKPSIEELEERFEKRKILIEERRKIIEEKKKEIELKGQQNSKPSKEELEERFEKRKILIEERRKIIEEKRN